MAKAMRMMEENLKLCDAVAAVLDARCPAASFNARLRALAGVKPQLFILNKADLADPVSTEAHLSLLAEGGVRAIKLTASAPSSARILRDALEELVSEKAARLRERGSKKPLRVMIAGIPNTGKSTLINLLAGAKKATTGDKAGVTRGKQWVSFELMDTPGTMPPACENQTFAQRLAFVGSINDDILAIDEIALALLEFMQSRYPMSLKERYGTCEGTPLELLGAVCLKRGFVLKGGEFDYERGVRAVIDDLRKGKLGRVCFDGGDDLKLSGLISG